MSDSPNLLETKTLIFDWGEDELAYLLDLAGLDSLPAFAIPASYTKAHAEAALRSLLARSVLLYDENGVLQINEAAARAVAAAGKATDWISVSQPSQPDYFFYFTDESIVYHANPMRGVQRLAFIDTVGFVVVIGNLLQLNPQDVTKPANAPVRLEMGLYQKLRQAVKSGERDIASQAGETLPANLFQALTQPTAMSIVSHVRPQQKPPVQASGFQIFHTPLGLWLLYPSGDHMDAVPANAQGALEAVTELLRP